MAEVPDTVWRVVLYSLAAVALVAALVVLWQGKTGSRLSPTRALLSICLGVLGYHAAAFASPSAWFPLQIPMDRFWLALALMMVGLAVSAWLDRRQLADQADGDRDQR